MITSEQLKETQKVLELLAKNEIDDPMTNHAKLKRLIKVADEIDTLRRSTWHNEKFGASETIVENMLSFNSDDIPF